MTFKYETIVNGPFQENCFLVWDDDDKKGILIDPGDEADRIVRTAQVLGVEILGIYNTHGHIDHAGAVAAIKEKLEIPFAMHPADQFLLELLPDQARMFGVPTRTVPKVDRPLAHDDTFAVGAHEAKVLHTPGHTPGGVCFAFDDAVFVGDTLFAGSIGRTDLPGGSLDEIITSIETRLMPLDDRVQVLSGHGPATTIGMERKHNPFLTGQF
jgi:glyoxylase-like metal-dependent hydrolase (beta-lactamase superfamily II)